MLVPEARSVCIPCGSGIFSQFEALERIVDAVRDAVFMPLPPAAPATVLQPEALKHTAGVQLSC